MEAYVSTACRFFASFVGTGLPLRLISELELSAIILRNTYFIAYYDEIGRLTRCDKMVYGDRVSSHIYEYYASGFQIGEHPLGR